MAKAKVIDDVYLINTPVDEMLEEGTITFTGESERDRMMSVMKFTRVRNLLLRYSQTLSKDEFTDILTYLKQFVVITKKE